jgi:hypothetical protein
MTARPGFISRSGLARAFVHPLGSPALLAGWMCVRAFPVLVVTGQLRRDRRRASAQQASRYFF